MLHLALPQAAIQRAAIPNVALSAVHIARIRAGLLLLTQDGYALATEDGTPITF